MPIHTQFIPFGRICHVAGKKAKDKNYKNVSLPSTSQILLKTFLPLPTSRGLPSKKHL
jgi:hypothetical protein